MKISELRKVFRAKLKPRPIHQNEYASGECYDMNVQEQLTELGKNRKIGNQKIFYLECSSSNVDEINLKLVSENVYIHETEY